MTTAASVIFYSSLNLKSQSGTVRVGQISLFVFFKDHRREFVERERRVFECCEPARSLTGRVTLSAVEGETVAADVEEL